MARSGLVDPAGPWAAGPRFPRTLGVVVVAALTEDTRWRCARCGNLTRFDVVRASRVKEYVHLDLAGEQQVEEREVLQDTVESVCCRWCGVADTVETIPRADAGP